MTHLGDNSVLAQLQRELSTLATVGNQESKQFLDTADQHKADVVTHEVQVGIAVLPIFGDLFHLIGNLFHSAHKTVAKPAPQPALNAPKASTAVPAPSDAGTPAPSDAGTPAPSDAGTPAPPLRARIGSRMAQNQPSAAQAPPGQAQET